MTGAGALGGGAGRLALPDFPWDALVPHAERARRVPGGIVDLSVGTPVDPTPALLRDALAAASDSPGYPQVWGTPAVREAVAGWFARRRGVPELDPDGVMPTPGSKELVAWLPTLLGLGPGDVVAHPAAAYPTYDVGARLAGAAPLALDDVASLASPQVELPGGGTGRIRLVWLNSPSNPTGAVDPVERLAAVVAWAREHDVVVASDECYAELGWRAPADGPAEGLDVDARGDVVVPSVLDPRVVGDDPSGVLAVYSLSKQSNLAGYRAAFVAGCPALVRALVAVRKHAGVIVPRPVQEVLRTALEDDAHVAEQKERYRARRDVLRPALEAAGGRVDGSVAGLYLWTTFGEPALATVARLADLGVLVAPGSFYGAAGEQHVRVALTASDERVAAAAQRLHG
ncbi:succinyldiaminopimelate transaminase [uncultured Pseudokineococcus sp.]|uniref:succinyldiaminopimelate transaminase n=1 Tax=uncultured Pseudokineococcus sp. TaxID=1642928 RepID=UPI00260D1DB7|nr:succinyldiaminopimelate transaminase [uncultured Pseudokineococcus sp.]